MQEDTSPQTSPTVQAPYILILFYSRGGATALMAETMAEGIQSVPGMDVRIRTVPSLSSGTQDAPLEDTNSAKPTHPFCTKDDLAQCSGLLLGSPTRFGNMAAPLKQFIDSTSDLWLNGDLIGKPASAFTSTSSLHGGQETTLMTMLLPLMHHGMLICGIPYSEAALHHTESGGTPYGPSHWNQSEPFTPLALTDDEEALCRSHGQRLAQIAQKLL